MRAIVLAGGRGVRMRPVTGGSAKEALRLGSRTVFERVLDELAGAGVSRVTVVSSPDKAPLFGGYETVIQAEPWGMGGAVTEALRATGVDGDALVLAGDTVFRGANPSATLAPFVSDAAIAVLPVDLDHVRLYGIVDQVAGRVRRIVEKPEPLDAPSNLAVAARYRLSADVQRELLAAGDAFSGPGEFNLTRFVGSLAEAGRDVRAVRFEAERVDCGDPESYERARELAWT